MTSKLDNIATVITGIYEKVHPHGDLLYLQGKHFDENGQFRDDVFANPDLPADDRLKKHLLKDGDILLIAKGESNRACLYLENIGPAVASSTFLVIRLFEPQLTPEFLQWYLNSHYMKEVFSGLSSGTQIASLSKKSLSETEIPIPPITIQRNIVHMQNLLNKEKSLTLALLGLKEAWYQKLLVHQANTFNNE